MNYFLTDDQKMIRDLAAQIAKEKIAPIAAELDETGEFPWEVVKTLGTSDLFRVFIPTEYDGLGGGMFEMALVVEELSKACGGIALSYAASGLGTIPIILFGTPEQKKTWLPRLASGEILAAFALTEPNAGSDAASIKTQAKPDGDSYVITGTKQWITNGGEATIYTVIALTDPTRGVRGSTALLVEKGTPGFDFGKKENKMGIRASATRELVFTDCRVPKSSILAQGGHGLPRGHEDLRPEPSRRGGAGRRASLRARWTRPWPTPRSASSSASRSRTSRACSSCSPTWPPRSRLPGR